MFLLAVLCPPSVFPMIFLWFAGNEGGWWSLGRTHGQVVECGVVAVCRRWGTRSEAANDGVAGTTLVRWTVAAVERQQ